MADAKGKSDENQDKENIDESGDSEVEDSGKDKNSVDKGKKKNAAPAPASKIKPPAKKRVKAEQAEETKKEKEKENKRKKPAPKEKEEEDEEEDDADEGDDEGTDGEENGVPEKVPLLDQPLEMSGSRERKQVERFIPKEELKSDADKKVEIPSGKGKPLGEIPHIQYQLNKLKADNLKGLHRILFNRVGQTHTIKKNIGLFKGFEFDKDSADFKKKLNIVTKLKNADLKTLCTILDLTKSGKHAELAERILEFLIKPVDSGKSAPDPRPKRKGISSKSYKELKTDADEDSKKVKSKQLAKKMSKASSEEDEQDEEDSDEKKTEDEEENETAGSEEDKPKKNTTKRPPPKNTAAAGTKKKTANGANKGKEKSESDSEQNSEAEEDAEKEPAAKKVKSSPPTDDEIKSYVKSVLEGANLEEITMKTVCKKVYEHYPDFDLGYKKEFIKNTVKSLIAS